MEQYLFYIFYRFLGESPFSEENFDATPAEDSNGIGNEAHGITEFLTGKHEGVRPRFRTENQRGLLQRAEEGDGGSQLF
jgi:hypothetical protein